MANRRVVVIGAGVLGSACAAELSAADDLEVTLLDRGAPGSGSTGLSAGIYSCQHLDQEGVEMRAWGIRRLEQLAANHGLVMRRIGTLRPSHTSDLTEAFHASVRLQEEYGVPGARVVNAEEFARLIPDLEYDDIDSAIYAEREGYIDGNELCSILSELATAQGVRIVGRAQLQGMRRAGQPK
jgi:sarcosine oxidase subunit beta